MADQYTLTQADVDACREILVRLEEADARTGGFHVGQVQGYTRAATATVHYQNAAGALVAADVLARSLEDVPLLGQLCKKVIAHCETHPEAVARG